MYSYPQIGVEWSNSDVGNNERSREGKILLCYCKDSTASVFLKNESDMKGKNKNGRRSG